MSGAVSFKLTGDKALDAKFAALPGAMQKRILRDALRPAAKLVLEAAKRSVPRRTGRMAGSLKVRAGKRSRKRPNAVTFIVQTAEGDFKGATYYAAFLEYGHRAGPRPLGTKRRHIEGKRYIKRALASVDDQARALAIKLVKEGLEREAKSASPR